MKTAKKIITLVLCVAIPLVIGFLSSMLAGDIRGKYEMMTKPPLAPPGGLFGIAWTILYILMGIAIFLIIVNRTTGRRKNAAIVLFIVQLALNFAWSPVFFGVGTLWAALVIILVMDVLVAVTIGVFYGINKIAALLMCPYLAWILFATYLNVSFALLNPGL